MIAADSISCDLVSEFFEINPAASKRSSLNNVFSIRSLTTLSVLRLTIGQ